LGVVANVMKARAVDGAEADLGFVDAVARGEGVGAGRIGVGAEEDAALHAEGFGDAGHPKGGGGEVEQAEHLGVHAVGFDLARGFYGFGVTDNHRHVQAAVPAPMDAAGVEPAVVGEEDDDGVFAEAVFF